MSIEDGYAICFNEWALDKNIKNELGLLLIIKYLCGRGNTCIVDTKYLCDLFEISNETIHRKLRILQSHNYITLEPKYQTDEEVFNYLNLKNSSTGCLFCGYNKYTLDRHHYPIRAKDGGTETITLCPNCHRAFHYLTSETSIYRVIFLKNTKGEI